MTLSAHSAYIMSEALKNYIKDGETKIVKAYDIQKAKLLIEGLEDMLKAYETN